ncbi:helix-turn-helix domain-containing protein [Sphingobacterium faecium]|uniref:helix-turn-helix domain-containing protein n=1 Tax=Sphingobacterium faecium TaxID=34087 RepID=UPI001884EB04|nr:helix-turn-helix domain-containing protein [Sphingobacterium faecium]
MDEIIRLLCKTAPHIHEVVYDKDQSEDASHDTKIPELLDIADVLVILNISIATYYRWVKQGELIPRRKGKRHYFYKEDLLHQLEQGRRRGRI